MLVNTSLGKQALISSIPRGRLPVCEAKKGPGGGGVGCGCSGLPHSSQDRRALAPCHSCQDLAWVVLAGSQGGLAAASSGSTFLTSSPTCCSAMVRSILTFPDLLSFVLVIANPQ